MPTSRYALSIYILRERLGVDGYTYQVIYLCYIHTQWAKLIEQTDHKIVEDLESLFVAYDDDDSGELEMEEVRELVGQLGTK